MSRRIWIPSGGAALLCLGLAVPRAGRAEDVEYVLRPISTEETGVERIVDPAGAAKEGEEQVGPKLPDGIPAAFAPLLRRQGFRFGARPKNEEGEAAADGLEVQPLYDFWLVREVPLIAQPAKELSINFGQLAPGTLVGFLRSYGKDYDYRGDPLDKGWHVLRYARQPDDGNHLGTSETRDYLLLTPPSEDTSPALMTDAEHHFKMAAAASSSGHAPILYMVSPGAGQSAQQPTLFQIESKEEWAVDLVLKGRVPEAETTSDVRMGLVLIGYVEEY